MKTKISCLFAAIIIGSTALAQVTNPPPTNPIDILPLLPSTTLDSEKLDIAIGTVMKGGTSFENTLSLRYIPTPAIGLAIETQQGVGATVLDSAGFYVHVRKAWTAYEVYGLGGARYNFNSKSLQGVAGLGVSYQPAASSSTLGILGKTTLFLEERLVIDGKDISNRKASSLAANTETVGGIRWPF